MSFAAPAESYDRFIGRYSRELAPRFAAFAGEAVPVLEVGCGPGALTEVLAARAGAAQVAAVDPSEPFVAACRARVPGADVRVAAAEQLPFADDAFGLCVAQLVLSFLRDAPKALAEMARVVRPGGVIAACVFEAHGFRMVRVFWDAALRFDPAAPDDARLPFRREPELRALWEGGGLRAVETAILDVAAAYTGFDDYWAPFASGIGPAASYLVKQAPERQAEIRDACFELLGAPAGGFTLPAQVLAVRGSV